MPLLEWMAQGGSAEEWHARLGGRSLPMSEGHVLLDGEVELLRAQVAAEKARIRANNASTARDAGRAAAQPKYSPRFCARQRSTPDPPPSRLFFLFLAKRRQIGKTASLMPLPGQRR